MRAASPTYTAYRAKPSARDRAASIGLALTIVGLLILVLIKMGGIPLLPPGDERPLSTFDVGSPAPAQERSSERTEQRRQEQTQRAERRPLPPAPPTLPPPPIELPGVINLSRADYAGADIGRIPSAAVEAGGKSAGGADSGSDQGVPGAGPGGETLYAAEWVREPTRAELATYLPARQESGWGVIACRTAERNRVDDCREMGETPGSGIARGLRRASWQFLVRPPRVNGKPMIGVWVRIKFDLTVGIEK
ncbi:hypothetical protein [Sphingomonas mucosissima]|uniref:Gram-negative bacterial tonB protein n=1 Tax=Sphingomonas mucosissima TaxID=370959 RepID=A0A245ZSE4_9SPHN|nr:hypothetical protein [Sphingomonas mucosissima]OWK32620.1 hypothetical protein SPMU_09570 [Sphingomonas mucosissima]